jgi:hypothetical protein
VLFPLASPARFSRCLQVDHRHCRPAANETIAPPPCRMPLGQSQCIPKLIPAAGEGRAMLSGSIDPHYAIAGFLVGALVGVTGIGDGSLMTPILIVLFGVSAAAQRPAGRARSAATGSDSAPCSRRLRADPESAEELEKSSPVKSGISPLSPPFHSFPTTSSCAAVGRLPRAAPILKTS